MSQRSSGDPATHSTLEALERGDVPQLRHLEDLYWLPLALRGPGRTLGGRLSRVDVEFVLILVKIYIIKMFRGMKMVIF